MKILKIIMVVMVALLYYEAVQAEEFRAGIYPKDGLTLEKGITSIELWVTGPYWPEKTTLHLNGDNKPMITYEKKVIEHKGPAKAEKSDYKLDEIVYFSEQVPPGSTLQVRVYWKKKKYVSFEFPLETPNAIFWSEGETCTPDRWTDVIYRIESLYGYDISQLKDVEVIINANSGTIMKKGEFFSVTDALRTYNYMVIHLTPEEAEMVGEGYAATQMVFNDGRSYSYLDWYYSPCEEQ